MSYELDLTGKVALVTGGGQGLGQATCELLYRAGASVAINYLDDPSGISRNRTESVVANFGQRGFAGAADVRSSEQMKDFLESIQRRFGKIDILVNNAAILRDRTMKKMSDTDWDDVIETNLSAVFRVSRTALPYLNDGARIINMASISGIVGTFGQANYSAAKAGVVGLTKVLSKELASRRILVNAVAPGVFLTEMGQSIPETVREQMLQQIPLKRFGEPDEVARVILFLCSDLASYVTGQTIHVNGGWWG
ncbi:MAG: 3-oxoacyl-ACP reductase FabG [Planctomyces sp.]|jgi:3-oxoacyl-[acyl-carrier protein] reductase